MKDFQSFNASMNKFGDFEFDGVMLPSKIFDELGSSDGILYGHTINTPDCIHQIYYTKRLTDNDLQKLKDAWSSFCL